MKNVNAISFSDVSVSGIPSYVSEGQITTVTISGNYNFLHLTGNCYTFDMRVVIAEDDIDHDTYNAFDSEYVDRGEVLSTCDCIAGYCTIPFSFPYDVDFSSKAGGLEGDRVEILTYLEVEDDGPNTVETIGSTGYYVVVDKDPPPTTTPLANPSSWTADTTPNIYDYSVIDSESGVDYYEYQIDSTTGSWTSVGLATDFNTPPQSDGTHTVYVRAVDKVGNIGNAGSVNIYINSKINCECASGECCSDGCFYDETGTKCQDGSNPSYTCASGNSLGSDVYVTTQYKKCSGSSASCSGSWYSNPAEVYNDCSTTQYCANNGDTSCTSCSTTCDYSCQSATCYTADPDCTSGGGSTRCTSVGGSCSGGKCVGGQDCTSGACCKDGKLLPGNYAFWVCYQSGIYEYKCTEGNMANDNVRRQEYQRFCDGVSPNCDGPLELREGWGVYADCGDNERCANDGDTSCTSVPAETCNGIDDDYDGHVDDNLAGDLCPLQNGVCSGSRKLCGGVSGWLNCGSYSYGAYYESVETMCDNQDNDCDGSTDESLTRQCGITDIGACAIGAETCTAGSWLACNAVFPANETCDSVDSDCDGILDGSENLGFKQCYTAADISYAGIGACSYGYYNCTNSGWSADCIGDVAPATEICNALDDDCDGIVDDGFNNESCEYVCQNYNFNWSGNGGSLNCCGNDANEASPYQLTEASCSDGKDNDCDGLIDNSDLDCQPCTEGQKTNCPNQAGVCSGSQQTCLGTSWPGCGLNEYNYTEYYGNPELICDNRDNDCDGSTDEGFNNENCQYACQNSGYAWTNNGGNLNCCGNDANEASPYQTNEKNPVDYCSDGKDNDCDGLSDNNDVDCLACPFHLHGWNKTAGGSGWDPAYGVAADSQDNIIVTGSTNSFGAGGVDLWTIKYDKDGNQLWSRTEGSSGNDYGSAAVIDSQDNVVSVGYTYSFGAGSSDFWIIKYDKNGNKLWSKTAGGSSVDIASSVAADSQDNIIVGGSTYSFGAGQYDFWTIKYDKNGNQLWSRTEGGSAWDTEEGVAADSQDNVIIVGYTKSFGAGGYDLRVIKYDKNGNQLWSKIVGGVNEEIGNGIAADSQDNVIVTGYTNSSGAGKYDIWTIKYNKDGNHLWNKTEGGTSDDYGSGVTIDGQDNVVVAGYTFSFGAGRSDVWTIKYNQDGNKLWSNITGGSDYDFGNGIAADSQDSTVIAGITQSFGAGGYDFWAIKYQNCADSDCDGYSSTGGVCGSVDCNDNSANAYPGAAETCNGVDDNCAGGVDDNLAGALCPLQLGVCLGKRKLCGGISGWLSCDSNAYGEDYELVETICDNKDNNCDGQKDEGGICKLSFKNNAGASIASFDSSGNLVLKGTLTQSSSYTPTSADEFRFQNSGGTDVALIDLATGNMYIKGSLFQNQGALSPAENSNDFIMQDSNGNAVAYINDLGHLFLKGTLTQNGNP